MDEMSNRSFTGGTSDTNQKEILGGVAIIGRQKLGFKLAGALGDRF